MNTIEVKNLKKHFGKVKAVDDVTFAIEEGEIFGFLGPNGAGKTTTIRCMMDFIRPSSGSITILGKDSMKDSVEINKQIGYLSGDVRLNAKWTGQEHMDFFSSLNGKHNDSKKLTEQLGLDPSIKSHQLSSGNKQKLALVLAFMSRPEILIFDEPTNALDPLLQRTVYELLDEAKERGATVFMSSHNLAEVERVCDRVGIIKKGKMVTVESIQSLKKKRLYYVRVLFSKHVAKKYLEVEGLTVDREIKHGYALSFKGDIQLLLKKLAEQPTTDIEISHASLEEIFMEYYER